MSERPRGSAWGTLRAWVDASGRPAYVMALTRLEAIPRTGTFCSRDLGESSRRPRKDGLARGVSVAPVLVKAEALGLIRWIGYSVGVGKAKRRVYRRVR